MKQRNEEIDSILAQIQLESREKSNPKINVLGILHAGCIIHLGHTLEKIASEHNGPLSVIENTVDKTLRFLPKTPLTIKAKYIEKEIYEAKAAKAAEPPNPLEGK